MKLLVIAKANRRDAKVEEVDPTHFHVWVKEPPIGGRANAAILKALAAFLNIPPSCLSIVSGHTSKRKVIAVLPAKKRAKSMKA